MNSMIDRLRNDRNLHPAFRAALPSKPETGRVCAICGLRTSPSGQKDTYGFGTILRRNGLFNGSDKAHRDCVSGLSNR